MIYDVLVLQYYVIIKTKFRASMTAMMRRVSTPTLCATASRTASLVGTKTSAWLVDLFIVVVLVDVGVVGAVDKTKISAWLVDLFIAIVVVGFVEE